MIDRSFGSIISCLAQIHCSVLLPRTSAWFVRCTVQFSKNHRSSSDLIILPHSQRFVKWFFWNLFHRSFERGRFISDGYNIITSWAIVSTGFFEFFMVQGSGRPWDVLALDYVWKPRLNEKWEMRNGGAAHKNMEAPRSINTGDAMSWHSSY